MRKLLVIPIFLFLAAKANAAYELHYNDCWNIKDTQNKIITLIELTGIHPTTFCYIAKPVKIYMGNYSDTIIYLQSGLREAKWDESVKGRFVAYLRPYRDSIYSGFCTLSIPVKDKHAYFSFIDREEKKKLVRHDLKELEDFYHVLYKGGDAQAFYQATLKKISRNIRSRRCSNYLGMLYLTGYSKYNSLFNKIITCGKPEARFALAMLLGNIPDERSGEILRKMITKEKGTIQLQAAKSYSFIQPDHAGKVLTDCLKKEFGFTKKNIFNISEYQEDYFDLDIEGIIKLIVRLNYTPAVNELLPLLNTNYYGLWLELSRMKNIDAEEISSFLSDFLLKNSDINKILYIADVICSNRIEKCVPALKKFISTHNRNSYSHSCNILFSLEKLGTVETYEFILNDFESFLRNSDDIHLLEKFNWIDTYISVLTDYLKRYNNSKLDKVEYLIDRALNELYGLNCSFFATPGMLDRKNQLEDSVKRMINDKIKYDCIGLPTWHEGVSIPCRSDEMIEVITYFGYVDNLNTSTFSDPWYKIYLCEPSERDSERLRNRISSIANVPPECIYYENGWSLLYFEPFHLLPGFCKYLREIDKGDRNNCIREIANILQIDCL